MTQETSKAVTSTADALRAATLMIDDKLTSIEDSLEIVRGKTAGSSEDASDRAGALRQLEHPEALDGSKKLLEELLAKANEESIRKDVKTQSHSVNVNFSGANYQGIQLGVSNAPITFGGNSR